MTIARVQDTRFQTFIIFANFSLTILNTPPRVTYPDFSDGHYVDNNSLKQESLANAR